MRQRNSETAKLRHCEIATLRTVAAAGLVVLAAMATQGCLSTVPMHTARPIPSGETQVRVSGGFHAVESKKGANSLSKQTLYPEASFRVRHGAGGSVDVGFFLHSAMFPPGAGFDVNIALIDREWGTLSLDPAVSIGWGYLDDVAGPFDVVAFQSLSTLNILMDVLRSQYVTLTIGLKPGYYYSEGFDGSGPALGASILADFQTRTSFALALMPFVDVTAWRTDQATYFANATAGVGFAF